jgi:hypothetical protein
LYICSVNTDKQNLQIMELIETTEQIAFNVIEQGNRKIKALTKHGRYYVEWININNHTCFIKHNKNSGCMVNSEDVRFYIQVPNNAKTIY